MAFSLGGLSAYTKQLVQPLLTDAVIGAKTQQLIMDGGIVIPKAKSSVAIPLMSTDAVFQNQSCSFNASGTTTVSQATITVGKIKVEESLCPKNLEAYFTQEAMKQGSTLDETSAPDLFKAFLDAKNKRIASQIETALWQGDTGSATNNLSYFNGIQRYITAAGTSINANVTGFVSGAPITTITSANVVAATEGIYRAIPAEVMAKGDVNIFVGYDWYRLLILAYRALNLFSYNPQDVNAEAFILPGTNVKVQPVNGLNGTGDAYAISLSNIALAVDLEAEEENYTMWWSKDNNDVRFRCEFKVGVGIPFVSEVVRFIAAI